MGIGGLPGGGSPAGLFAAHLQKPKAQDFRWYLDRRAGDHWIELGHFESKRLAKLGMAEAIAAGELKEQLRLRRG